MRLLIAATLLAVAAAVPAAAAAPEPPDVSHVGDCFRQYVTRVEPVPRTPEEHVAAAVQEVRYTVRFATCLAA